METDNRLFRWIKPKKDQLLIGILAGVLLLVIVFPSGEGKKTQTDLQQVSDGMQVIGSETSWTSRETELEQRLQTILEQTAGAGRVQVMITMKTSVSQEAEKDCSVSEEHTGGTAEESSASSREEEATVYVRDSDGRETPFIRKEYAPEIEGVLVAAGGGDNMKVVKEITEAVQVLFGVEVHKIKVMKLD